MKHGLGGRAGRVGCGLEVVVEEPFSRWGSTSARQKKYANFFFTMGFTLTIDPVLTVLLKVK